MNINEL